jgi:hypothetical protein
MKIKNYLMAAVGFGILVGSIILSQPFVSHSQNELPPTRVVVTNLPLEVRSVDEAPPCCVPKQPFRKFVHVVAGPSGRSARVDFVVPGGKRLVIENVSLNGVVAPGEQVEVGFSYSSPGSLMYQYFPVTFQLAEGFAPGTPFEERRVNFVASQQMRLYVDPVESGTPTTISAFAVRNPVYGDLIVEFWFSGFLVDLP